MVHILATTQIKNEVKKLFKDKNSKEAETLKAHLEPFMLVPCFGTLLYLLIPIKTRTIFRTFLKITFKLPPCIRKQQKSSVRKHAAAALENNPNFKDNNFDSGPGLVYSKSKN